MSYWSHNVEKMNEIIENNLPEPWKTKLMKGEIELLDVPSDIQCNAFTKGEPDYWGGLIDDAYEKLKDERP
jgi:hypothetical protein